jgi:hypothetical protein
MVLARLRTRCAICSIRSIGNIFTEDPLGDISTPARRRSPGHNMLNANALHERATLTQFLAQVTEAQVFVNAS